MKTIVEVIGVNDDTVMIAGDEAGRDGIWLASEVTGFYDLEVEETTKPYANRPGSRFIRSRPMARTVVFTVSIENGEGVRETWRERDERWRRLWDYSRYSTIRVTTDESSRTLSCRLLKIEVDTRYDPHVGTVTDAVMTVVADDPYWYAPDFVQEINVSGLSAFRAESTNPTGNVVYPIYVLEAPGKWEVYDFDVLGNPTRSVPIPELTEGQHLVINTDPASRQLMSDDESLVWAKMNGVRFTGGIPPHRDGMDIPIRRVEGTGKAQIRIRRPHDRPWGF